jgi:hypothetical protein
VTAASVPWLPCGRSEGRRHGCRVGGGAYRHTSNCCAQPVGTGRPGPRLRGRPHWSLLLCRGSHAQAVRPSDGTRPADPSAHRNRRIAAPLVINLKTVKALGLTIRGRYCYCYRRITASNESLLCTPTSAPAPSSPPPSASRCSTRGANRRRRLLPGSGSGCSQLLGVGCRPRFFARMEILAWREVLGGGHVARAPGGGGSTTSCWAGRLRAAAATPLVALRHLESAQSKGVHTLIPGGG